MTDHRWRNWVTPDALRILSVARGPLKAAWQADGRDPSSYPVNTEWALSRIMLALSPARKKGTKSRSMLKVPKTLAELIPETRVRFVWENSHHDSFESAIKAAWNTTYENLETSRKAFKAILRAIELSYYGYHWGWELLPKPKVSLVHRGLLDVGKLAGLEDLTGEGFAEFLDDICPCGLRTHTGAFRKFLRRSGKTIRITS